MLAALGLAPSSADPSLIMRTNTSLPPFYILVYVDNLVLATADTETLALVKSELQKRHTCTDLGELRSYLGLQITRDRARHTIILTQSHMVHQKLGEEREEGMEGREEGREEREEEEREEGEERVGVEKGEEGGKEEEETEEGEGEEDPGDTEQTTHTCYSAPDPNSPAQ
ncbi:unnamed protein product [Closterium sp. NIES-54]